MNLDVMEDFSPMSTLRDNSGPALRIHQLPRDSILPPLHPTMDNFHFLQKISENCRSKFTFSHSLLSYFLMATVWLKLGTLTFSQLGDPCIAFLLQAISTSSSNNSPRIRKIERRYLKVQRIFKL